jgi:hypothetical protein
LQRPLRQSLSALQDLVGLQPEQFGPPQSTSDSPWLETPSWQVGAWQVPPSQTPDWQSPSLVQLFWAEHPEQFGPPQSTSVSF